jgi:hypothetical protein
MSKGSYPNVLEVLVVALRPVVAKNMCQFSGPTTIFSTSHTKWPSETFFFSPPIDTIIYIHVKGKLPKWTGSPCSSSGASSS